MWNSVQAQNAARSHETRFGIKLLLLLVVYLLFVIGNNLFAQPATSLTVSYDVTRELYQDYNKSFPAHWQQKTDTDVLINKR
jgi:sulfate transport system substrate-binding protein